MINYVDDWKVPESPFVEFVGGPPTYVRSIQRADDDAIRYLWHDDERGRAPVP